MDPVRLSGRIKYVHTKKPVSFSVVSFESQKIFKCFYKGFCMVQVNDVVMLICVKINENELEIVAPPYLLVTDERDVVIQSLIEATKSLRDKKLTPVKCDELYKWLVSACGESQNLESAVSKYLSKISYEWDQYRSYPPELDEILKRDQITCILKWWERYHDRRRLWMLGLNDKDIRKSRLNLDDLYDLCVENPFRVPSLDLNKCQQILARQMRNPEDGQMLCGMISRLVYDNLRKRGWSGTPEVTLLERFNQLLELKEELVDKYQLTFDRNLVFLRESYEVETETAEFIINSCRETVEEIRPETNGLSPDQVTAITGALNSRLSIITGPAGTGKCLSPDTPVLMSDGRVVEARRLYPGDCLMGQDGRPRLILGVTSGYDRMFKIVAEDGSSFVCNYPHVLTLIRKNGELFDIPLNEYLAAPVEGYLYRPPVKVPHQKDFLDFLPTYLKREIGKTDATFFRQSMIESISPKVFEIQSDRIDYWLWSVGRTKNKPSEEKRVLQFTVEPVGYGPYFGFELDGDGRFLLGNFIVTHNTTSIRGIVENLERYRKDYGICTPTGKAASRVKEAIDRPAYTIHRFINMVKKAGADLDSDLTLPLSHIIIDEASMVTTELFYSLVKTVQSVQGEIPFSVVLVGDINQLPPIGWGSIMESCLKSRRVPTFYLTENHRQKEGNGVILNAKAIIEYQSPIPYEFVITPHFWVQNGTIHDVKTHLKLWREQGITSKNIKIITPYVKELPMLNYIAQIMFYSGQPEVKDPRGFLWIVDDLVIMLVNNYEIDVMNGDEGRVAGIDGDGISVTFKEKTHKFLFPTLEEIGKKLEIDPITGESKNISSLSTLFLTHSFALSVHKSQGSEWQKVIIYLPQLELNAVNFVNKNLLYTAITRARESVVCIGSELIFSAAVSSRPKAKYESLKVRLEEQLPIVAPEIQGSIQELDPDEDDCPYDEDY